MGISRKNSHGQKDPLIFTECQEKRAKGPPSISRKPTTILSGYDVRPPTQEREDFHEVRSLNHLFKVSELKSGPGGSQSRSVCLWSLVLKSGD